MTNDTNGAETREIVVGMYEAAAAGDVDRAVSVLSQDLVVFEPDYLPFGGRHDGLEAFGALAGQVGGILDMASLSIESVAAAGPRAFVHLQIPLAKEDGIVDMVEELTVSDGKITEIRVYWANLPKSAGSSAGGE